MYERQLLTDRLYARAVKTGRIHPYIYIYIYIEREREREREIDRERER